MFSELVTFCLLDVLSARFLLTMDAAAAESRPEVGSSRIITSGLVTSSVATAVRRR